MKGTKMNDAEERLKEMVRELLVADVLPTDRGVEKTPNEATLQSSA
jgi:hypothetical protein